MKNGEMSEYKIHQMYFMESLSIALYLRTAVSRRYDNDVMIILSLSSKCYGSRARHL